jgi:hypothetical protein
MAGHAWTAARRSIAGALAFAALFGCERRAPVEASPAVNPAEASTAVTEAEDAGADVAAAERPCPPRAPLAPVAFAQEVTRSGPGFSVEMPRFVAGDAKSAALLAPVRAALDASKARCKRGDGGYGVPCTSEAIVCDVVRDDGTYLGVRCTAEAQLENRSRAYYRAWQLDFRREGDRFVPLVLADIARDRDATKLAEALSLGADALSRPSFLLGDDAIVAEPTMATMMAPTYVAMPGSDVRELLVCDDALALPAGAAGAPLVLGVRFDAVRAIPRFRGVGPAAAAIDAAIDSWTAQPGGDGGDCRVTRSTAALVSVACVASPLYGGPGAPIAPATFTFRVTDGARL